MAVTIKSEREIELMREPCRLLAIVHKEMEEAIRPGMTTMDIDRLQSMTCKEESFTNRK